MKRISLLLFFVFGLLKANAQILYSDYSDPDVCEGGQGDYWLTASSFQCSPGLPILHSTDLQHWQLVNYAIDVVPTPAYDPFTQFGSHHGKGVWAPSIRRHNDTYYIYWGDPDQGVFMVETKDPAGRWSQPVLVVAGKGIIDPCPLWDEDGRVYLVNGWAASRCGLNSVLTMRELSADGTRAISQPTLVYDGQVEGNHTVEGPKLYKHDGYYYILAPAGGVEKGWQIALRSKNVYGPYESKVVFNHEGIHQGGWVADSFVCFQERTAYGRILHLLDVKMKDGWPMMSLGKRDKPQSLVYQASPYQWHTNYQESFGFPLTSVSPLYPNAMRIYGYNVSPRFRNCWEVPNLYLRKLDGEVFDDTLHLRITAKSNGQQSGFIIMGRDYCRLSAELRDGQFLISKCTCKDAEKDSEEQVELLTTIPARRYGAGAKTNYECHLTVALHCEKMALCHISYCADQSGKFQSAGSFQAREGKWIGAKYGAFSIAPNGSDKGWVDVFLIPT